MEEDKKKEFNPTVLVLSAGGIKGIDQLGCLYQFKKEGLLDNINTYIGTSIGSIISLFLNCDIEPQDVLLEALDMKLFNSYDDIQLKILGGFGVLKHKSIIAPVEKLIKTKYDPVPTMKELYEYTGKKLICITTNLTDAEAMYISYENFPDLLVSDAVMMSSNVPGIFPMIEYNKCNFVDGAFLKPFAINYLDDGNTDILGITINEENFNENDSPINYAYKITSIMFDALQMEEIKHPSDRCKIIHLKVRHVGVLNRNTDPHERAETFGDGIEQAKEFIKNGYVSKRVPRKKVKKYLVKRKKRQSNIPQNIIDSSELKNERRVQTIVPRDNVEETKKDLILPETENQKILADKNFSISDLPKGYEIEYDKKKDKHYIVMSRKDRKKTGKSDKQKKKSNHIPNNYYDDISRDDISDEEESDEEYNKQVNKQISDTVQLIGKGVSLMLNPSRKAKKEKEQRRKELSDNRNNDFSNLAGKTMLNVFIKSMSGDLNDPRYYNPNGYHHHVRQSTSPIIEEIVDDE